MGFVSYWSKPNNRYFVALAFGLLALNLYAPASPTPTQRLIASLLLIAAAFPTWIWMNQKERAVPFLPLWAGLYGLYYALPVFSLEKFSRTAYIRTIIGEKFIATGLLYALLGLLFLYAGYFGLKSSPLRLGLKWENQKALAVLGMLLGITGIAVYSTHLDGLQIPLALQQARVLLGDLSLIAIAIFYVLQLKKQSNRYMHGFLWGFLVPGRILLGLATGSTLQGIVVILFLVLIFAAERHRMPWIGLAVGLMLVFLIRPIQTEFRKLTWNVGQQNQQLTAQPVESTATPTTGEPDSSLIEPNELPIAPPTNPASDEAPSQPLDLLEKVRIFGQTLFNSLTKPRTTANQRFQFTVSRLGHLTTFAEVIRLTPQNVPYWNGETYRSLATKAIPRFLFPGKPQENIGQQFGHRYSFLREDDFSTSYNLPQLVELYANFGLLGITIGMFFLGVVYKFIQLSLTFRRAELGTVVAANLIGLKLLNMETNLSAVFGGLPWLLVLILAVHLAYLLMNRVFTRKPG